MGRVRSSLVKRTARKLLESYPDIFTGSFEHNKAVVGQLLELKSKKLRNQVAGYITHTVNAALKRKGAAQKEEPEEL
ncbi:MAG: 30S ribosomal protein S17e [Acidilobaceae archaeon]